MEEGSESEVCDCEAVSSDIFLSFKSLFHDSEPLWQSFGEVVEEELFLFFLVLTQVDLSDLAQLVIYRVQCRINDPGLLWIFRPVAVCLTKCAQNSLCLA